VENGSVKDLPKINMVIFPCFEDLPIKHAHFHSFLMFFLCLPTGFIRWPQEHQGIQALSCAFGIQLPRLQEISDTMPWPFLEIVGGINIH
jgi:hypothetical protein